MEKGQGMGQEGRREVRSSLGNVQSGCRLGQGQGQVAGQSILAFPSFFSLRSSDGKHHVFIFIFYFMYVCIYLFILFYTILFELLILKAGLTEQSPRKITCKTAVKAITEGRTHRIHRGESGTS